MPIGTSIILLPRLESPSRVWLHGGDGVALVSDSLTSLHSLRHDIRSIGRLLHDHWCRSGMGNSLAGCEGSGVAPGPVDSLETGARGWLIWISIALLLGDSSVRVLAAFAKLVLGLKRLVQPISPSYRPINVMPASDPINRPLLGESATAADDTTGHTSCRETVSARMVAIWMLISTSLCIVFTFLVFGQDIRLQVVNVAVALAFPFCLISIQSTGETDTVPSNALSKASPQHRIPHPSRLHVGKHRAARQRRQPAPGSHGGCYWPLFWSLPACVLSSSPPGKSLVAGLGSKRNRNLHR